MFKELFIVSLLSFLLSYAGTWGMRRIALLHSIVDIPNRRSSHDVPTPRGGGVSLILTFYAVGGYLALTAQVSVPHILGLGMCGLGIALTGLCDDLIHVSAGKRLISHFFWAFLAVYFFTEHDFFLFGTSGGLFSLLLLLFTAVMIVWLLNLYNFMDGIDGLAASQALSVSLGASIILYIIGETSNHLPLLISLAACSLGFLIWNWPPAKIFMGDACSCFLGFFFGIFALLTISSTLMNFWTWLMLLAVFIVDSTVTLCVRIWRGERFYEAHRSHAYQILSRRLGSHLKVTLLSMGINWLVLIPLAYLTVIKPESGVFITIFSYAVLSLFCIVVGAGRRND